MGFFSWDDTEKKRALAAIEFLSTGKVYTGLGGTRCNNTNQCGSNFSCVNGQCIPSGVTNGGGGCGSGVGNGQVCASPVGGSTTCASSNCGSQSGDATDCCGNRYCRWEGNPGSQYPIVNCACGTDPIIGASCNSFCDSYNQNFDQQAAGCSSGNTCSECSTCNGSNCVPSTSGPCHCNPNAVPDCYVCNDDGTTSKGNNCSNCCDLRNVECSCGKTVDAFACEDPNANVTAAACNIAQALANQKCAEICAVTPGNPDECAGSCQSKTQCYPSGSAPATPDCPPGSNCNVTGSIEGGGQKCFLYNECDMSNVPARCKACDCHCSNDCPACQICNAQGKCEADPACPNLSTATYWKMTYDHIIRITGQRDCLNGQTQSDSYQVISGALDTRTYMDLSNYQRQVYDMTGETTGPHTNSWRCGGNSANDNYGEANMFRYGTQKVPGGPFTGVLDTTGGSTPPLWVTYPEGVQYNKIFEFDRTDEFTNLKFRRYPY